MSATFDAAVIGSGPNGLSAAIALAQQGRRVVVIEAHESPGGGVRTTEEWTLPGFRHDICSAIHPMGIGSPFWNGLDLQAHGLKWIHPKAPLSHPFDDGPAALLEESVEATADTLGLDAERYGDWIGPFASQWPALAQDALAPLGWPDHPVLMARFGARAFRAATALAESSFHDPRTQAWFGGLAAHSVLPLDQSPSAAIGLMLLVAGHAVGWPFPEGGAGALTDALVRKLESLGGTVLCGQRVTHTDQVPTAGPILFDVSPHALADMGGTDLPDSFCDKLRRYRFGPGVFKVDWALSEPIPWKDPAVARGGTVHIGGSLEEIAASERAACNGIHGDKPFVLLAQQSLFDPTRAPEGKQVAWGYCHVPSGSTVDRTVAIEAQIERFAPGFQDCILARHTWNTADYSAYNPNLVGGDVVGGVADLRQLLARPTARRVPYSTPNPRLYLCSASTPPGGGVHGMCGFNAAQAVLKGDSS